VSAPKHSPLPWSVGAVNDDFVYDGSGHLIARVTRQSRPFDEVGRADDAEHIVRCVNVHDDLVAALGVAWTLPLGCSVDGLNPCWAERPADVVGKHWGGGDACANCTAAGTIRAALKKAGVAR
jgi:hypothetical protein